MGSLWRLLRILRRFRSRRSGVGSGRRNGPGSYNGSRGSTQTVDDYSRERLVPGMVPIGTMLPVLPAGAFSTQVNGTYYYYYNDTYYKPVFSGSQVVYV